MDPKKSSATFHVRALSHPGRGRPRDVFVTISAGELFYLCAFCERKLMLVTEIDFFSFSLPCCSSPFFLTLSHLLSLPCPIIKAFFHSSSLSVQSQDCSKVISRVKRWNIRRRSSWLYGAAAAAAEAKLMMRTPQERERERETESGRKHVQSGLHL